MKTPDAAQVPEVFTQSTNPSPETVPPVGPFGVAWPGPATSPRMCTSDREQAEPSPPAQSE
ncbi:hypothetical protein BJF78_34835 [Pseudonocardia sp. CNS-139]|nr:hypothetical protein BJF78_34835 [Pseudonocardia sp. CNS-139]